MKIKENYARFKTIEQPRADEEHDQRNGVPQLVDLLSIYKPKKQTIQSFSQPGEYSRSGAKVYCKPSINTISKILATKQRTRLPIHVRLHQQQTQARVTANQIEQEEKLRLRSREAKLRRNYELAQSQKYQTINVEHSNMLDSLQGSRPLGDNKLEAREMRYDKSRERSNGRCGPISLSDGSDPGLLLSQDRLSHTQFNALQEHLNRTMSQTSKIEQVGQKIYDKGVRMKEAKEKQMQLLRQQKADEELIGVTFKPQLNKPKSTPKVVIRKGQQVQASSPSRQEMLKQQRDTSHRLMRYGMERDAKRVEMKKIKEQLEGSEYDFKPTTCDKSNRIVQKKQKQLLTQYLQGRMVFAEYPESAPMGDDDNDVPRDPSPEGDGVRVKSASRNLSPGVVRQASPQSNLQTSYLNLEGNKLN